MKTNQVIDHIVRWLGDYCKESGLKGFVIGVSGGIDSAVTSTLCAKTGKEVLALNMPIYQDPEQESLSARHIRWLEENFPNVRGIKADLSNVFSSLEETLPMDIQDDLTMANTRSRLRMLTLYAFASHHRLLVAGTGNKVEDFGVGFYTKYGDGGVDLSPIAGLLKSQVYELGRALGVHESIINAPPTDGLWADNRTDESQIGATYAELEWAMQFMEAAGDETGLNSRQKEVLKIFLRFNASNKHKMSPIPVCGIPDCLKLA
jgi:NAD+ synthase